MINFGFVNAHWAIGMTVLIGLAAAEFSGAKALLAIPTAALSVTFSALCRNREDNNLLKYRKRGLNDLIDFLCIWFDILSYLSAGAICARIASVILDYMSYGKIREIIFGLQTNVNEEPWPDIFGVTVILIVTVLFMFGLESSKTLSMILVFSIISGYLFLTVVGGTNTNVSYRKWNQDFKLHNWESVFVTAAVCSFGFVKDFSSLITPSFILIFLTMLATIMFYSSMVVIFTFTSHYRDLAGTAIPLIRIFEVRDIGWARPFMAAFAMTVTCLALIDIITIVYKLFTKLATKEWHILVFSIRYRSTFTGTPILAIFVSGSLAAILAFACPLPHLVRLLNVCFLLECIFNSSSSIFNRYKPMFPYNEIDMPDTGVQYCRLSNNSKSKDKHRPTKSAFRIFIDKAKKSRSRKNVHKGQEKDCLIMNDYDVHQSITSNLCNSDSELSDSLGNNDAEESSSSSTDVDAVVDEYMATVQVATVKNFDNKTYSTNNSFRFMILVITLTGIVALLISISMILKKYYIIWPCIVVLVTLQCVTLKIPQNFNELSKDHIIPPFLFSVIALLSITSNIIIASTLVETIWPGLAFWIFSGCLLFWRCNCCTCEGLIKNEQESEFKNPVVGRLFVQYNETPENDEVILSTS